MAGNLGERLEYTLYQILCGDDVRPKLFSMRDARRYLQDVADDPPEVAGCVLEVKPKGQKYSVVQLMVNKEGQLIKNGKDAYLGRTLTANEIDDSVVRFMNGETRRTILLDTDAE